MPIFTEQQISHLVEYRMLLRLGLEQLKGGGRQLS